jgi:hypothetical protein
MAPVGAQTAWMLRPFFGRPAEAHVPFLRHRESSFLDAVAKSARSSVGIYDLDPLRRVPCAPPDVCGARESMENGL